MICVPKSTIAALQKTIEDLMKRKEFLYFLGKGGAVVCFGSCLFGCSEDSGILEPPANVDFTIDLTDEANISLTNVGGSIYRNQVIIVHISQDNYSAFSQACTHEAFIIQYQHSNNRLHCPNHGSHFDLNGNVLNGPASRNLKKYNVSLEENILRIFS
jgi:cytochrome b6-f complex iron-sulfur subunit